MGFKALGRGVQHLLQRKKQDVLKMWFYGITKPCTAFVTAFVEAVTADDDDVRQAA